MKRRIFVALTFSKNLQKEIGNFRKDFGHLPVRWIEEKNLHLTLIPPWYVEDPQGTIRLLKSFKNISSFTIVFRHVSFGPDPKKPRLIWASGKTPQKLTYLKTKLEGMLKRKKEKQSFISHATLARFKREDFTNFPIKELSENVFWQERVTSFSLMESTLSPKGAKYKVLFSFASYDWQK